jgi:hypothetical protein
LNSSDSSRHAVRGRSRFLVVTRWTSRCLQVDKHLAKPPFRFIHDIVMELMETTGCVSRPRRLPLHRSRSARLLLTQWCALRCRFARGVFEGIELDGKLLKDKPEKVAFFDKLIRYTGSVLNESIAVSAALPTPACAALLTA